MVTAAPKFTPGPWEAVAGGEGPDEHWSIFVDEEELAAVYLASGKQQANARLIAAAPELYVALTAAEHALRSYQYGNSAPALAEEVANKARAALAKVAP